MLVQLDTYMRPQSHASDVYIVVGCIRMQIIGLFFQVFNL
jgi:hypothetical protein